MATMQVTFTNGTVVTLDAKPGAGDEFRGWSGACSGSGSCALTVEDREDRRVRRIAITAKGKKLVDTLVVVRQAGMETFAASLTAAQRRKLDAAVDSLMDRDDIAEAFAHLKEVGPA